MMNIFDPSVSILWLLPLVAYLVSRILTRLLVQFGPKTYPTERDTHEDPTVISGGISIIVVAILGVGLFYAIFLQGGNYLVGSHQAKITIPLLKAWIPMLVATIFLAIVSLWDDIRSLSYRLRIIVHLVCGLILFGQFPMGAQAAWGVFLTVTLINACNFIDGLNGILMINWIIGIMVSIFYLIMTDPQLILFLAPFVIIIAGVIGVLGSNFPKATIFLGDVGSTFLGLCLSFLVMFSQYCGPTILGLSKTTFFVFFPFGFLLFDLAFTLCHRLVSGRSLTNSYRDYLFHRLHRVGYSHVKITLLYAYATLFNSILVIGFIFSYWGILTIIGCYVFAQVGMLWFILSRTRI